MAGQPAGAAPGGSAGRVAGFLLAITAAGIAGLLASFIPEVSARRPVEAAWRWVDAFDVSLAFRLDGLSMVFALLISVFGSATALYASSYLRGHPHLVRFFLYLALFMAGMLGLVLSNDLIVMFVFWEATTVASFLLIGFDQTEKARRSAWMSLLVTGAGGLALLGGLVLLAAAAGTTRISEIVAAGSLGAHALYPAILSLVLIGAFSKSAQVPFHIWLPNAMAAPTPVSAYLHSATMVKAGVFLLARFHPALSGTEAWTWALSVTGAVTMTMAAFLALRQTDLKLALAYTSVMALGALVMFLGSEAPIAIAAAVTFLVVHALYKASLFFVVGAIDHATGTREIARLGGLWRRMPMTSLAAVLAAGSMAGFPPFLGFIGKELKYEGALAIAEEPIALAIAAVVSNALMVALALTIILRVVFGRPGETPQTPHEVPVAMWIGPIVLASLGLVWGVAPDLVGQSLVQPAVTAILGHPETVKLKLWHGINVPLLMSLATVALGVLGFLLHRPLGRLIARVPGVGDRAWDGLLALVANLFALASRGMQPGSLRFYLVVTFAAVAVPPLVFLLSDGVPVPGAGEIDVAGAVAVLFAAIGAVLAAVAQRRMVAIGGLGAVGTGLAMLFTIYGAPDVAITQLLVDVLLVVLIAAVMLRLPDLGPRRSGRGADAAVGLAVGVSVAALTLAVTAVPFHEGIPDAMERMSAAEAYGRNIVNVVLVDFRALDTFGEIVVVAAASVGALALIRMRARRKEVGA